MSLEWTPIIRPTRGEAPGMLAAGLILWLVIVFVEGGL